MPLTVDAKIEASRLEYTRDHAFRVQVNLAFQELVRHGRLSPLATLDQTLAFPLPGGQVLGSFLLERYMASLESTQRQRLRDLEQGSNRFRAWR